MLLNDLIYENIRLLTKSVAMSYNLKPFINSFIVSNDFPLSVVQCCLIFTHVENSRHLGISQPNGATVQSHEHDKVFNQCGMLTLKYCCA